MTITTKRSRITKNATLMQKKALNEIGKQVRTGKRISVGAAMRTAGYSPTTAQKGMAGLKKGFQELLDEFLPDDLLAQTHNELLKDESKRIRVLALDMAYKLKKRYSIEVSVTSQIRSKSDSELLEVIRSNGLELPSGSESSPQDDATDLATDLPEVLEGETI